MFNRTPSNEIVLSSRPALTAQQKFSRFAAPVLGLAVALSSQAFAVEDLTSLNSSVSTGVGTITATVGTVAAVAVGIALIIWGAMKIKPRG